MVGNKTLRDAARAELDRIAATSKDAAGGGA